LSVPKNRESVRRPPSLALPRKGGGNGALRIEKLCRACVAPTQAFLSFGALPLANALVAPDAPSSEEERYPLTLTVCTSCRLVQLAETVDPAKLFRQYVYLSSMSPAFVEHAGRLARRLIAERALGPASKVVEIASNDGYLLQHYREAGVPVIGIDPAVNVAQVAAQRDIQTICEFFTAELAGSLKARGEQADVLHANNVLAHVADLPDFVAGIAAILRPDGVAVIEFPYLRELIANLEFDTVYHEHLCYFSLTPLVALFRRCGLAVNQVERIPVHGGSLRLFVQHAGAAGPHPSVADMLAQEIAWGVADDATYRGFASATTQLRDSIPSLLRQLRARGRSMAAYGASAKGATLLNYCGIGRETIDAVFDRSPLKQGLAMPGVRIPIRAADELVRARPDYTLLLAWNFSDEIIAQQAEYCRNGGRFIVPVPSPRIVPAEADSGHAPP